MKARRDVLEQRRHPRIPLGTKGKLHLAGARTLNGVFLDISYGGAKLETPRSIEPRFLIGQTGRIEIPTLVEQSEGRLGPLTATVVWAKLQENGRLRLGLQFSTASSASLRLVVPNLGTTPR